MRTFIDVVSWAECWLMCAAQRLSYVELITFRYHEKWQLPNTGTCHSAVFEHSTRWDMSFYMRWGDLQSTWLIRFEWRCCGSNIIRILFNQPSLRHSGLWEMDVTVVIHPIKTSQSTQVNRLISKIQIERIVNHPINNRNDRVSFETSHLPFRQANVQHNNETNLLL